MICYFNQLELSLKLEVEARNCGVTKGTPVSTGLRWMQMPPNASVLVFRQLTNFGLILDSFSCRYSVPYSALPVNIKE